MNKFGVAKFNGKNIFGYGNVRLGPHYYHFLLEKFSKNKKILKTIAEKHGYKMVEKNHYIAFPATSWKRVVYRLGMLFLPWNIKVRNFILLFQKK